MHFHEVIESSRLRLPEMVNIWIDDKRKTFKGFANSFLQLTIRILNGGPDKRGPEKRGPDKRSPDKRGPDKRGPDKRGPDKRGPDKRLE